MEDILWHGRGREETFYAFKFNYFAQEVSLGLRRFFMSVANRKFSGKKLNLVTTDISCGCEMNFKWGKQDEKMIIVEEGQDTRDKRSKFNFCRH